MIPKSAGLTELRLVEMMAPDAPPAAAAVEDRVGEGLRGAAVAGAPMRFDRIFFAWYWSLISAN